MFQTTKKGHLPNVLGFNGQSNQQDAEGNKIVHMDVGIEVPAGHVVCLMGKKDSGASAVLLTIMEENYIT